MTAWGVLLLCVTVLTGRAVGVSTYSTELQLENYNLYIADGLDNQVIYKPDWTYPANTANVPISETERKTSSDGGTTMPWSLVTDGPDPFNDCIGRPRQITQFYYEITDPGLLDGQYILLEVGVTGAQTLSFLNTEGLNFGLYALLLNSTGSYPDNVLVRSEIPVTRNMPLDDQSQLSAFVVIPPTINLTGTELWMGFNIRQTSFVNTNCGYLVGSDETYLPPTAYMRITSFLLDYVAVSPVETSQATYSAESPMRVVANIIDSPMNILDTTPIRSSIQNRDVYRITTNTLDSQYTGRDRIQFNVEALVDDPQQFILVESTIYGWQTDTTANNVAHFVKAILVRDGEENVEIDGTKGIQQFDEDAVRSTKSVLLIPADSITVAGDKVVVEMYIYTLSGVSDGFITLQDENVGKGNPSSGWSIGIRTLGVSIT